MGVVGGGEVEVGAVGVGEVVGQVEGAEGLGVDLQGGEGESAGDGLGKGLDMLGSTPSSCSFLRYLLATTRPKLSLLTFLHSYPLSTYEKELLGETEKEMLLPSK